MKTSIFTLVLSLLVVWSPAQDAASSYKVEFKPGALDEFISITTPDGKVLKNARVVKVTYDKIGIVHDEGASTFPLGDMPGEIKARFKYDKGKALRGDAVVGGGGYFPAAIPSVEVALTESSSTMVPDVPADIRGIIRMNAEKKWRDNFDMVNYEIERQAKAAQKMAAYITNGIPSIPVEVGGRIIQQAQEKWRDNFDMVNYEIERQAAAWLKLNR